MDKTGQASLKHQKELVEFDVKTSFFSLGNSAENLLLLFLDLLDRLYNDTLSLKSCEINFKSPLQARRDTTGDTRQSALCNSATSVKVKRKGI